MATCKSSVTSLVLAAVAGGIFALVGAQALSQNTTKDMKDAGKQAIKDAKDAAKDAAKNAGDKAKDAMGMPEGMPPEMQKYMQNMMECGTPGPAHAEMAKMAGTWTFTCQMWMMPNMPPMESSGTTTYKAIFGGRVLQGEMEGVGMMMGEKQSFQGMELMGFDNWTGKTWNVWVGSDCTSPWFGTGTHDSATKTCTMEGKAPNFWAAKGTLATSRSKMTMTDDNNGVFEMWGPGPDGKEFKNFEMKMTRKK